MHVNPAIEPVFLFGPYSLAPNQQLLLRQRQPVKLGGRALNILNLLLMRAGEEVSARSLIEFAQPNVSVENWT